MIWAKLFKKAFPEGQGRALAAGIVTTLMLLVLIGIGTAVLWLLDKLWRVAELSPFGAWGFSTVLVVASVVAGLGCFMWIRRHTDPSRKPIKWTDVIKLSQRGRRLVEQWKGEIETGGATNKPPARKLPEPRPVESAYVLKERIIEIVKSAKAARNVTALANAEGQLTTLEKNYPDPDTAQWVAQYREEIKRLK